MTYFLFSIIVPAIVSILAVNWAYFKILKIAKDKNLVDNPDARKLQKDPIPVMGGIAVFFGVTMGLLAGAVLKNCAGIPMMSPLLPVLAAMMMMLYTGALDDIVGLTPKSRLVIEVLTMLGLIYASGGCIDSFHGLWGVYGFSWWIAVPLTVFAGVGIINAVNMVDGVNGLSSGLCITCCVLFGAAFFRAGDYQNTTLAFVMAASLTPFLIHNVFGLRSRMFIGDAGTMVMGVMISWFVISTLRSDSPVVYYAAAKGVNMIAMALAIVSVPIFDTIRVMTMRMAHKKSPFSADKTHLHHIFIKLGVSHFITAVCEIVIDLIIFAIWAACVSMNVGYDCQLYIVIGAAMFFVWGTYGFLTYQANHHTEFLHKVTGFSVRTHLGRTDWWKRFTAYLDAPEDRLKTKMADRAEAPKKAARTFDLSDPNNYKEQDRKRIWDFSKGRAEVYVEDIKRNAGADPMRVYPIIHEEVLAGNMKVIKAGIWGTPEIISVVED